VFLTAPGHDASGGVIRDELAAAVVGPGLAHRPGRHRQRHRRDDAVPAHVCGPARADPLPRTRVNTIAVSRSCTCASTGSPSSAFHGGHHPGQCRQPGEPAFPPACASAAATSCIPGCTPRTGESPQQARKRRGPVLPPAFAGAIGRILAASRPPASIAERGQVALAPRGRIAEMACMLIASGPTRAACRTPRPRCSMSAPVASDTRRPAAACEPGNALRRRPG
jgi:hypothetical protein